jgi:hypothetical protein
MCVRHCLVKEAIVTASPVSRFAMSPKESAIAYIPQNTSVCREVWTKKWLSEEMRFCTGSTVECTTRVMYCE